MEETKIRDRGIDLARCVAILAVLMIHTASVAVTAYAPGSGGWFGTMFWGSLVRFAVPVFFMCSGAVFLGRDVSYRDLFLKYILRIAAALLVWSALYEAFDFLRGFHTGWTGVREAVKNVLTLNNHFHFYYLEIILLVYLFLPVLRVFTKHAGRNTMLYGLALWFFTGILIPTFGGFYPFTAWSGLIRRWYLPQAWAAMGYALLGYFIAAGEKKTRVYLPLLLLGFAVTFGGGAAANWSGGEFSETFWGGMTLGPCLMAAGVFGLCRNYSGRGKAVTFVSGGSFCVYLCHDFFNIILRHFGLSPAELMPAVSIPLLSILVLGLSLGVYAVLRLIPGVRRWLI